MLSALIVCPSLVVLVTFANWLVRRVQEGHALAGRFGAVERERAIARRAAAQLNSLESLLHVTASDARSRRERVTDMLTSGPRRWRQRVVVRRSASRGA